MRSSRRRIFAGLMAALSVAAAFWAAEGQAAGLTADEIVAKHLAARGGAGAWHAVQTMSWAGKSAPR